VAVLLEAGIRSAKAPVDFLLFFVTLWHFCFAFTVKSDSVNIFLCLEALLLCEFFPYDSECSDGVDRPE
jgi:hypothetical protein